MKYKQNNYMTLALLGTVFLMLSVFVHGDTGQAWQNIVVDAGNSEAIHLGAGETLELRDSDQS